MMTLGFGGDTSLGDVHIRSVQPHLKPVLKDRPESFFEEVGPLLAGCDQVVINLETVLARRPDSPWVGKKRYLGWDTPSQTIRALKSINTTHVSLANNHTMDFGGDILMQTMSCLDDAGIAHVGAGADIFQACSPRVVFLPGNGEGRRIYLIAGMEVQRALRDDFKFYAGVDSPGVNPLTAQRLIGCIRGIKAADPGALVIVMPHWGGNYKWASDNMQVLESAFSRAGADIIVGHGAHMLQQLRSRNGGATIFSLGNFVFNWAGRFDAFNAPPFGLVARLEVAPDQDGWHGLSKVYPILSDNRKTGYKPRPVNESEFQAVKEVLERKAIDSSMEDAFSGGKDERGWFLCCEIRTSMQRNSDGVSK